MATKIQAAPAFLQASLVMPPVKAACNVSNMGGSKKPRPDAVAMGRRIAKAREAVGITVSELARRLKVRAQSVQQWESGQTQPKSARLTDIARALNCSVHLLTHDEAEHDDLWNGVEPLPLPKFRLVPLISWVQAGNWQDAMTQHEIEHAEKTIPSRYQVSDRAFATRVRGDSMEPIFPDGCVVIVDPNVRPKDGSYVVARIEGSAEATFKKLVFDGERQLLVPLNPRYPVIVPSKPTTIVGVVIESYQTFV